MNTQLLGTLRLTIIDELRAEIREREGVIADLTRDEEPMQPPETMGLMPFFHDERTNGLQPTPRPVHGDAIAKVREEKREDTIRKLVGKNRAGTKVIHASKGKRHRRTPEDIEAMGKKLLAYVTKNPGQRGETIAKALGTDVGTMRKPMKSLGYLIRTKGKRRGTTYFAK